MPPSAARIAAVVLALISACQPAPAAPIEPIPTPPARAASSSIPDVPAGERMTRGDHDAILSELRRAGHNLPDFPKQFPAVDVTGWTPLQTTATATVSSTNAFARSPDGEAFGVDERVFSTLKVVDTTSLAAGDRIEIGVIRKTDADPSDVVRCLIQADVLLTWAHLGSQLTLSEPRRTETHVVVDVSGTHTYMTGEENTDPLAFRVSIDAGGAILVTGRPTT